MVVRTASMTNLYGFPIGRRVFVQREVEKRARARAIGAVADKAAQGVAHDTALMTTMLRSRAGSEALYGPEAVSMDNLVDHCVTGLDGYLDSQGRLFRGEPRGAAGDRLRQALMPEGPAAVIRLPYAQQHAEIDAMLARLEEAELAKYLAALPELAAMTDRLRSMNQKYGELLNAYERQPSRDELRAADEHGQELLAETVALVLAHFITSAPDDQEGRAHLLEPILRQNEAIRATRRRRRQPRDVDPDTGVEFPEGSEPIEDEAPAA